MRGRDEKYAELMAKVELNLQNYPSCMYEFFIYLRQDKSPITVRQYIDRMCRFIDYYALRNGKASNQVTNEELYGIKTVFVDEYIVYQKEKEVKRKNSTGRINPTTQSCIFCAINAFYSMAMERRYILDNPIDGKIKRPKLRKEDNVVYMTKEELNIFVSNMTYEMKTANDRTHDIRWTRQRVLVMLIYLTTGIRKSALTYLNMEDLHLKDGYFIATDKEDKTREYYLTEEALILFDRWLKDREQILNGKDIPAVFINNRRERMNGNSVDKIVKRYSDGINKNITPHKLRHTFATNLYKLTGDIYAVADSLNHSDLSHVRKYVTAGEEGRKKSTLLMGDFITGKVDYK